MDRGRSPNFQAHFVTFFAKRELVLLLLLCLIKEDSVSFVLLNGVFFLATVWIYWRNYPYLSIYLSVLLSIS